MFNRDSRFTKLSALSALAGFSFATLRTAPAAAYNYQTHSRIVELAVHAMQTNTGLLLPPTGEEAAFNAYLNALATAPAKLALLKTGLPTSTVDGGYNPIPGTSDDTSGYPYSAATPVSCALLPGGETRDLNRLNDFRIADLGYFPDATGPCGLTPPAKDLDRAQGADPNDPASVTARNIELVLGWHGASIDGHLNDSALWVRPSLVGFFGIASEAASLYFELAVGTILLPFVCAWDAIFGDGCDLDSSYALARQYNPVDEIQGAIPGVGDIRDGIFTGLWHFESVDAEVNRFNDTRGMWYPGAGPTYPGAFDVFILAGTAASGLSLNAGISDGPGNYGGFDQTHRTKPQWQAHSVGLLEWSPLHNLAAYGWSRFKSDPSDAVGLAWPLHAIGDACEPQHVTSTSSWGHRTYEDWVNENLSTYLPYAFDAKGNALPDAQAALDAELTTAIYSGFRWWKQFSQGEDMAGLIHDLAVETRQEIKDEGDWPFQDIYSTVYVTDPDSATASYGAFMIVHNADVTKLLTNAIGAAAAVLAVAAQKVPNNPRGDIDCPAGQTFGFTQKTRVVTPSRGPQYTQVYTVPECSAQQSPIVSGVVPSTVGIGQIGAGPGTGGTGGAGGTGGGSCTTCDDAQNFDCSEPIACNNACPVTEYCSGGCCISAIVK